MIAHSILVTKPCVYIASISYLSTNDHIIDRKLFPHPQISGLDNLDCSFFS